MTLQGIDISSYQATTPDLSPYAFVFCRATYGTSVDVMYAKHSAAVRKASEVLGAYAFGRSATKAPIADQVSVFLAVAKDADLLALDLEGDGANVGMTNAEATAFIAAVHAAGRTIGLYHSDSGYPTLGQDWNWVASWGRLAPARPWTFWQFRGSPLDLDTFNGDAAALKALISEGSMGLSVRLAATADASAPWTSFGTAIVAKDNVSAVRVADAVLKPLPKGTSVDVVTLGETRQVIGSWPAGTPLVLTNIDGVLYALVKAEVTFAPIAPPVPPPPPTTTTTVTGQNVKIIGPA